MSSTWITGMICVMCSRKRGIIWLLPLPSAELLSSFSYLNSSAKHTRLCSMTNLASSTERRNGAYPVSDAAFSTTHERRLFGTRIPINVSSMGHEAFIPAALLLIILDDLWWTNLSFIRVLPCSAKGTSLTQKIPALVQFNLYFR